MIAFEIIKAARKKPCHHRYIMIKILKKIQTGSSQKSLNRNKFILLFQGRTGSTYVTDRLNAHPVIKMDPEVWGGWGFQVQESEIAEHIKMQQNWLRRFYLQEHHKGMKAIGFKTKIDDVLEKRDFINFLREHQLRIIHMTRRNMVKLVISEINAQRLYDKVSTWNLESEKDRPGPFELDLDRFDEQLRWREQIEAWLASYIKLISLPTLTLCYEDMLYDNRAFFSRIYEFLGVPFVDTVGKTFKNTSNDLRNVITNFDALLARYKYTIYEPMIIDV